MKPIVSIAGRPIGPGHPPYVIAELSGNHRGDIGRAITLIEAAHAAGADAVKLQTYTPDTITIDHDGPGFVIEEGLWRGRRLYELYQEAHTPWDWHERLFDTARTLGITVFSSPFDATAIALLQSLDAPAYKIASFEIVDLPLVRMAGETGRPLIISTGMASLPEIEDAVGVAQNHANGGLVLLHCVSGYPTSADEANLRTIPDMFERFGVPVGLSDHTLGTAVAVAAVAMGASVIEKHVTIARADGGPDAAFSLEPDEFEHLVTDCRDAWAALGAVTYDQASSEAAVIGLRRSVYVVADIAAGDVFTADNVRSIRPGHGLPPKHLPAVLGRCAAHTLPRGTPLSWDDIAPDKSSIS